MQTDKGWITPYTLSESPIQCDGEWSFHAHQSIAPSSSVTDIFLYLDNNNNNFMHTYIFVMTTLDVLDE